MLERRGCSVRILLVEAMEVLVGMTQELGNIRITSADASNELKRKLVRFPKSGNPYLRRKYRYFSSGPKKVSIVA